MNVHYESDVSQHEDGAENDGQNNQESRLETNDLYLNAPSNEV